MKQSLRLGTISGIPVGLNWGLLVIAFLYLLNLATAILPASSPGFSTSAYWLTATAGVVLFFGSILAHELGHSLVAQREGIRVRAITLWLLGGVAEIEKEADTPGAEFRIAAAGPAVSVALAVGFFASGYALGEVFGPSLIATMLTWLGLINGLLAVFNLIPAAPLDGGRILSAVLWWRSGNPHRARARAAMAGQGFGVLMLGLGTLLLLNGGGFWILILAWFLYAGATAERRRADVFDVASTASVGEAMAPLVSPTDGAVSAAGLLAMGGSASVAFPVRGDQGAIVGLVPASAVQRLPAGQRDTTRARDLVVPWSDFVSARADERLSVVVDRFRSADLEHALVYDSWGNQAGYVGLAELMNAGRLVRS